MHQAYYTATGWLSLLAACALSWVVLTSTVREGIVIKAGLILMVAGLFSTAALTLTGAYSLRGLLNAGLALRLGLCIVIAGYWLKTRRAKHYCLRASDWRDTRHGGTT